MNKFLLNFLFIFIFIIINFNNNNKYHSVNSQFTTISTSSQLTVFILNNNPIYKTYPKSTSSNQCSINFDFLVSDPSILSTGSPPSLTIFSNDSSVFTNLVQIKSFGSTTVHYNFNGLINYKSISFNINAKNPDNNLQSNYNLIFSCNKIDLITMVTFTAPGGDKMYYTPSLGFYVILKLTLTNDHVFESLDSGNPSLSYIPILALPNHFIIIASPSYLLSQSSITSSVIGFPIQFDFQSTTVFFKSYYSVSNNQPMPELKTYPTNLNLTFQEFGFKNEPVFTYNFNTNSSRPFQFIKNENSYYYTKPIKGIAGNMTFQGYLLPPNIDSIFNSSGSGGSGVVSNTFSFYNEFQSFNFTSTIIGYQMPILGSVILIQTTPTTNVNTLAQFYNIKFDNLQPYGFAKLIYSIDGGIEKLEESWPFGFYHGNFNTYSHQVSFFLPGSSSLNTKFTFEIYSLGNQKDSIPINIPITYNPIVTPPDIKTFSFVKVSLSKIIFAFTVVSNIGIDKITYAGKTYNIGEILISGNLLSGTYEILIDAYLFSLGTLECIDKYGISSVLTVGSVVLNPTLFYEPPSFLDTKLSMSSFSNITFLKNNLNLIDKDCYNIMYLTSTDIPINGIMNLILMDPVSISRDVIYYPIKYDSNLKLFTCNFIVPKNNLPDEIPFAIVLSNGVILNTNQGPKLLVSQSKLDNQGPLFSTITKFGEGVMISTDNTKVGWIFTITDELNGFESGYIKVIGNVDSSIHYFNFTILDRINGDKSIGQYKISIDIMQRCVDQVYQITNVILYDSNKIPSIFNLNSDLEVDPTINPFINYYDSSSNDGGISITKLSITCNPQYNIEDKNQPILTSFATYPLTIDVGSLNRIVSVNFTIEFTTSGIKKSQLPIVYFASSKLQLHKCISSLISMDAAFAYYSCITELPLGFAFPDPILISIYGIVNNGGYFNGFSTNEIAIVKPSDYFIQTTLTTTQPIITSSDIIYTTDDSILIYGKGFLNAYKILLNYTSTFPAFVVFGSTAIQIRNLTLPSQPFTIQVMTISQPSNKFTISPIFFSTQDQTPTPSVTPSDTPIVTPSDTPSVSPTQTLKPTLPPVTSAPKKCIGSPECGGSTNGKCVNNECVCVSPWSGLDCLSKVIELPPPVVNTVRPSTNLTFSNNNNNNPTTSSTTGTNSDGSSSSSTTTSLVGSISIVSLRELDFNRNVIKTMKFDKWDQTNLGPNKNHYSTEITSGCIVNVTTEWFESLTNIQFADHSFEMNPSTLKYNINITSYSFSGQLNSLQLVIQATALVNKVEDDTCSDKQYGEIVNDNSNYVQLSVDKYSLYARFIKRAIVDDQFINVGNTQLNDLKDQSNYYTADSYIAIEIPRYSHLIQLDPDFSMLINPTNADSICKSKNGISRNALIGIVIGSFGGACIIAVSIILLIKYKYRIKYSINTFKLKKINK